MRRRNVNQTRSSSTRLTPAIGTRKRFAAISAIRSKAGSGGVSRIWYCRSAFKRSASFSGSTGFMASTPEQSQSLAAGDRKFLRSLRAIVILRFFVVQRIRQPSGKLDALSRFSITLRLARKLSWIRAISREATMSGSRDQNRIQPVDPDHATGALRQLFAEIRTKFALVPNLFRVLAT